jgi:hypothetical protein
MNRICENLHDYSDICKMYHCVNNIQGIQTDSSSPTDTWIVDYNPNTYYNDKLQNSGFIKLFINPNSIILSDFIGFNININYLHGLEYEIKVYRDIIRPLIDNNICPNFIKFLGSSNSCTFNDLENIISSGVHGQDIDLIRAQLVYNIEAMLLKNHQRNSITDFKPLYQLNTIDNFDQDAMFRLKYSLLVTEPMMAGTYKFREWLNFNTVQGVKFSVEIWKVIFQLMAACYAMSMSKTVHNDIHSDNSYCIQIPDTEVCYIYNNQTYTFNSNIRLKVYDFDRSYTERLGDNISLNDHLCNVFSQCNLFLNKDMIKALCYIYSVATDIDKQYILDCLTDRQNIQRTISKLYNTPDCFLQIDNFAIPPHFYQNLNPPEIILDNIAKLAQTNQNLIADLNNVFICNNTMFERNGKLKPFNRAESYLDKLNITIIEAENRNERILYNTNIQKEQKSKNQAIKQRDLCNTNLQKEKQLGNEQKTFLTQQIKIIKKTNKNISDISNTNLQKEQEEKIQAIKQRDLCNTHLQKEQQLGDKETKNLLEKIKVISAENFSLKEEIRILKQGYFEDKKEDKKEDEKEDEKEDKKEDEKEDKCRDDKDCLQFQNCNNKLCKPGSLERGKCKKVDQVVNPVTGRCVNKGGVVYKKLLLKKK